jgi:hypothetical protein
MGQGKSIEIIMIKTKSVPSLSNLLLLKLS